MKLISKVRHILEPKEQKLGVFVMLVFVGMAFLDMVSIASIMPFLSVISDQKIISENQILNNLYNFSKNLWVNTEADFTIFLGFLTFFVVVFAAAFRAFAFYIMNNFIYMRSHSLSVRMIEICLRQPYDFFLNKHSGDISKTALSEVGQVISYVFVPIFNVIASSLQVIAITLLLFYVDPYLAIIAGILIGGFYTSIFLGLKKKLSKLGTTLVETNKARFKTASEALAGIKIIKLLGCENLEINRFSKASQTFNSTQAFHQVSNQIPSFIVEAILFGAMILFTLYLLMSSDYKSSNQLSEIIPLIGLYGFAAYRLKPAINSIYSGLTSLRYGHAAIDSLYSFMNLHTNIVKQKELTSNLRIRNKIILKDISFKYSGSKNYILKDINFEIPIGTTLGLAGKTGSGKTTLIDILIGLLKPSKGTIYIDGTKLENQNISEWRKSIGYVPQEIFLTDTNISENIAFGTPTSQIDLDRVKTCAKLADIHIFIENQLPQGYNTFVGERGGRLSGGQRQRIGIARALYYDPDIIIFDEATSALDNSTEKAVMQAINKLSGIKTIIIIAHKLVTLKKCDNIIILKNGKVKSKGKFDDLINTNVDFNDMISKDFEVI